MVLSGRNEARLAEIARGIEAVGGHCAYFPADLCDAGSISRMVDAINTASYRIDVLINNAADTTSKPCLETSLDEIERIIRSNMIGPLQLTRLVAPGMVARRRGVIVNMSSLAGYKPDPAQTVYSVSKGGINAVSEALYAELRGSGVHVLNVALMGIGTGPRKVPVESLARRLERAIERGDPELFLYRRTKWQSAGHYPARGERFVRGDRRRREFLHYRVHRHDEHDP